jgi:hypothetical protein
MAKLAQWTVPLRYFPTRSLIKTWANTVPYKADIHRN